MLTAGVFSVLPTPFVSGGDVDHESLARLVELTIAAGVNGITVLGVASETSRLNERERRAVIQTVVDHAAGRTTVVAGTSSDGVRTCVELSRDAKKIGVNAVLVSPSRLPKLGSESVVNHYKLVAESVDLPIVVQDYPALCGFGMEAGLLARIAREVPAARTIKLEDPPTPAKAARVLAATGETRVTVLGGLGGTFLFEELLSGAAGTMTAFAYPEILVAVVGAYKAGDVDAAADLFYRFVPLLRFEYQDVIGTAIRKEIYRRRGVLADASMRAPGAVLDEQTRAALDRVLAWTGPDSWFEKHSAGPRAVGP